MIYSFDQHTPRLAQGAWVAPTAALIGDVVVGCDTSIWFGAVVRGDVEAVRIGARTNIQDQVTVHVTGGRHPTVVGDEVTVGHGAVLHGCTVGSRVLVGMGALIMDGARVGTGALVAAGSLVPPGAEVPAGMLVRGRPARPVRPLSASDLAAIDASAARYVELAGRYRSSSGG